MKHGKTAVEAAKDALEANKVVKKAQLEAAEKKAKEDAAESAIELSRKSKSKSKS